MSVITAASLLSKLSHLTAAAKGEPNEHPQRASNTFASALASGVRSINESQQNATRIADAFQAGQPGVPLYKTMLATQEASLNLQMGVQVRNGLVGAYNDIMNMQV